MNLILLFAYLVSSGCSASITSSHSDPSHSKTSVTNPYNHLLYVVATGVEYPFGKRNELIVLNADTFEEINRTRLMDNTLFFKFSQDPLGQIWIGYAGALENPTKRVDVFASDGTLLRSMDLCTWPNVTISFAAGAAFVPCYLNGFHAQLAIIDLNTYAVKTRIELTAEPHFSLLSSSANQRTVLIIGSSQTHGTLLFFNPITGDLQYNVSIYGGANIKTIIHHENRFYLLNKGSSLNTDNPIDMRIVDYADPPIITDYRMAERSPALGFIVGDVLWTYHHPLPTAQNSERRSISQYELTTGKTKSWRLPDHWWAGDMILLNGKIVLTRRHSIDPNETDGLYEFNSETGQLSQILELPGAHLLLVGQQNVE